MPASEVLSGSLVIEVAGDRAIHVKYMHSGATNVTSTAYLQLMEDKMLIPRELAGMKQKSNGPCLWL